MFGFLKDKLKKAVKKFSSDTEGEVNEEKVEDSKEIEKAKEEEKKILRKSSKKPAKKPSPKKPSKKIASKPKEKPQKKTSSKTNDSIEKQEKPVEKQGFLGKIFGKKDIEEEVKEEFQKEKQELEKIKDKPEDPEILELEKKELQEEIEEKTLEKKKIKEKPPEMPDVEELEEEILEDEALEEEEGLGDEELYTEDVDEELDEEEDIEEEESQNFFGRLKDAFTKKTLTPEKFDELFWELEVTLLENNVAVEVIEKIKEDLKHELTSGKVNRMGIEDMIMQRLRQSVDELFDVPQIDLIERINKSSEPYKICVIGVNGSGKTTTLAKLIKLLQNNKLSVVVAASDTFRAAAIDQLKEHTDKLGVKLVSQGYDSDPAAVAFDAVEYAKARNIDVVLIDTAGRLHSNTNLMAELEKVVRVSKPDLKLFVGESITGNDCVEQAKEFNKLVGIDAIILSKADIDDKGGAALSVSYVTKKPIIYLGTGQKYEDLEAFSRLKMLDSLGL